MFVKASKEQVMPSIFIFLWIFAINIFSAVCIPGMEPWPMYFVTIFFFVMGGDTKNISTIFGGALTGLILVGVLSKLLIVLTPIMGLLPTVIILLFVVLGLIIVGGNFCPILLNNITFAYLTITTIIFDPELILSKVVSWTIMLLIGGGIILGGALLIFTLVQKSMSKN